MSNLKYVKFKDVLAVLQFFIVLPFALVAKIFIRGFWLVAEEKFEARDNGYWFYKYVCENHPTQKIAYALDKRSADYEKVKKLGRVISYGTWQHWFWYLVAEKNISSQKGAKPNAAVCNLFEIKIPILKTKRYFLQHGITINNGEWLYYMNCKFQMFVCGAKPEYDYVKQHFGYPEDKIKYLGFTRFDNLQDCEVDKDLILVMPTWRSYLVRQKGEDFDFESTKYYKEWNAFLNDPKLAELLETYGKKLLFYPHRNMQRYIHHFSTGSTRIEIADVKKYDIADVLKQSALMITDYSSVFFDFSYMKKPVIFYQFDEKEYRENQYKEGYFDYHNNPLGKFADTLQGCFTLLHNELKNGIMVNDNVKDFFELYDSKNCERTYLAIKEN